MTPETERRFVDLVVRRGIVRDADLRGLAQRREAEKGARKRTLPRLVCDAGFMKSADARALLAEVRAGARPAIAGARPATAETVLMPGGEARERTVVGAPDAMAVAPVHEPDPEEGSGDLLAGAQLGPYRIDSILGRGGMGVVYRARDIRLNREVALKTISGAADRETVERFLREAKAAGRLKHPGIVPVFEVGVHKGVRFMALELVDGATLATYLRATGPLPPLKAATILRDLALAVAFAHAAGVIHRDLKPGNVLLGADERPRLTDFGLARDAREKDLTNTGDVLGTPVYMSPEQARGERMLVSSATDVWALGAILYELLAGRPPFTGRTGLEVLRKVESEEPESPSRVRAGRGLDPLGPDVETIVLRCLEKDPKKRYATAAELADELTRFIEHRPILARPRSLGEQYDIAGLLRAGPMALAAWAVMTVGLILVLSPYLIELWYWRFVRSWPPAALVVVNGYVPMLLVASYLGWRLIAARLPATRRGVLSVALLVTFVVLAGAATSATAAAAAAAAAADAAAADAADAAADADAADAAADATGDPAAAVRRLTAVLEKHAQHATTSEHFIPVWTCRGLLRARLGDGGGALADLEQATRIAPDSPRSAVAFETLGLVLLEGGRLDAAISAESRALALEARKTAPWHLRARARFAKGDLEGALADLEKLHELAPFDRARWREWRPRLEGAVSGLSSELARRVEGFLGKLEKD